MSEDLLRVYITIDTETSMGGAWHNPASAPLGLERTVYGECGGRQYGIPLIMDILEQHSFRGTFFTEVFCSYALGEEPVGKLLRYIRERGHDAQLHLHPIYRFYRNAKDGKPAREIDLMHRLPAAEQRDLIADGVRIFRELAGSAPRAYRAGCYGASEETLDALHHNGILLDSSYNLAYLGQTCGFSMPGLNGPASIQGVCEIPVTVFRVAGVSGFKPLEISAVSVREIVTSIRTLKRTGCRDVVLVLHSFSLMKNLGQRFEACTPDEIVIRRLRRLCAALSELRGECRVVTFGETDPAGVPAGQQYAIPSIGPFYPAIRKFVQGVNRLPWV